MGAWEDVYGSVWECGREGCRRRVATMAVRTNNCTRGCVVVLLWANRVEKRAGRCEAGVGAVVPTKRCLYPFVNVGVMRGSRVGLVESEKEEEEEEEELSSDSCS